MTPGMEHVTVRTDPVTGEFVAESAYANGDVVAEVDRASTMSELEEKVSHWFLVRRAKQKD